MMTTSTLCRVIALVSTSCALAPAVVYAASAVPVAYLADEEETTWQPIWRDDVAKVVETTALDVLTADGTLQLTPVTKKDLAKLTRGYLLRIIGRMVEETEIHTVHLAFESLDQAEIGSFRAADSVTIGKLNRGVMLERIEQSTRKAAKQLILTLGPALARSLGQSAAAPPLSKDTGLTPPQLPWTWGAVEIPKFSTPHAADLTSASENKRQAALRELAAAALTGAAPRHALESCVLKHKDAKLRLGCLIALRPLSRREPATQRVVIEVLRTDEDNQVMAEASDQMLYFTGMSHAEAVQAWLERTAKDGRVIGPLDRLGDLPNLDTVVVRCLMAAKDPLNSTSQKRSCLDLLKPVPHQRRLAILWPFLRELEPRSPRYLVGVGDREGSHGTDWATALDLVVERASAFPPELEEVLWLRYERTLSTAALDKLSAYAAPTAANVKRMTAVMQSSGDNDPLWGLLRMGQRRPELKGQIREALAEVLATGTYNKKLSSRQIEEVMAKLEDKK